MGFNMGFQLFQVDAFTDRPFAGNPAAVCLLTDERDAGWLQSVAQEMNLAETAFVMRRDGGFGLRWFTPTVEVDLCGHATLAIAHALWETGTLAQDEPARFWTKSGMLTCTRDGEWIEMDFPALPTEPAEAPAGMLESLGVDSTFVGRSRVDYLVEVSSEEAVRNAAPDFPKLKEGATRGEIVSRKSFTRNYDFVSPFLSP